MDHYENIYCVVRGEKVFTLLPPADVAFLGERAGYPSGGVP
jgi:jumonji domain-containing protein 7